MRSKRFFTLLILFLSTLFSNGQSVIGTWKTIDNQTGEAKSYVKIYEENGKLKGKVIKLLDRPQDFKCIKCKGDKKDQLVLGMNIIWGMKKDEKEWKGGTILDTKDGSAYDCKFWLDEDDSNQLKVRGYVAFFYRTQTWYRVK